MTATSTTRARATAIPGIWRPAKLRKVPGIVLGAVFVLVMIVWTFLPIYGMVETAFTSRATVFENELWPSSPTLENFAILFAAGDASPLPQFWVQIGNSLGTALGTTALVLTIGILASFALARLRPNWGAPVSSLALVLYVVPASFLAIPLYLVMGNLGLLESIPGLILALSTLATPYAVWMLRQFGTSIPTEIEEAARVDGAGVLRMLFAIYIPLMKNALIPVAMYVFLLSWNDFLYAFLFLTNPEQLTIPVAMNSIITEGSPWTILMASGLVYALPPVILFIVVRRYLTGGTTTGSTTG